MDLGRLKRDGEYRWRIPRQGPMRAAGILYGDREQILQMDDKVYTQLRNVTLLPGIVGPAYAMPDAHWGYGFPIGGVAAMDPETGVISPGGIGFDINCGMRLVRTDLRWPEVKARLPELVDALAARVPAGVGRRGFVKLSLIHI